MMKQPITPAATGPIGAIIRKEGTDKTKIDYRCSVQNYTAQGEFNKSFLCCYGKANYMFQSATSFLQRILLIIGSFTNLQVKEERNSRFVEESQIS